MKTCIYMLASVFALVAAVFACTTEVPVTVQIEVPVTRLVPETVEVEATREVEVTREVDVTREVPVTRIAEVTREVDVTREVPVTRISVATVEVPVTRQVEVTREVEATRQVEVTREVVATRVVVETVEVPVTRTVQVTREVPVTRVVEITRLVDPTPDPDEYRRTPSDLCADYPYMIRVAETLRDFFGEAADLAAKGRPSYVTNAATARNIREQAHTDVLAMISNWYGICGITPIPPVYRTREMLSPEGRGVCRAAVDAILSDVTTFSNNVQDDDTVDAFLDFTNAYANHCDNDFGR